MIILKCGYSKGSAAFPAKLIEGYQAPVRRYAIIDGEIVLSGYDDVILKHDAEQLLTQSDNLYRVLTPKEQNARTQAKQEAATVEESAPAEAPAPKKSIGG